MGKIKNRKGEIHITNEGYKVEIIDYRGTKDCDIQYEDGYIINNITYGQIKLGNIHKPYHKGILGVGYTGIGDYKTYENKKRAKSYLKWVGMLRRCYDKNYQIKKTSYIGCTVDENWHNLQNFAKWHDENYTEGFELDKDILFKNNKVYSQNTCCFVPSQINMLFVKLEKTRGEYPIGIRKTPTGKFQARVSIEGKYKHLGTFDTIEEAFQAYKEAKENNIKRLANLYKNKITPQCYKALMEYEVEITD